MSGLREARDAKGYSREYVGRTLDPPVTGKTIERWEAGKKVKGWRLEQLATLYSTSVAALNGAREKAA